MSDFDSDVDELLALAEEQYPEPVDALEDDLASKLGFHRGPGCSLSEWRRTRVQLIESARRQRPRRRARSKPGA